MNSFDIQFHMRLVGFLEKEIADGSMSLWETPQADFAAYRAEAAKMQALKRVIDEAEAIRRDLLGENLRS